jgi:hypothetical protein
MRRRSGANTMPADASNRRPGFALFLAELDSNRYEFGMAFRRQ